MEIPKIDDLHGNFLGKFYIQKHYPEFYQYLLNRYKQIPIKKFSEYLYLYYHSLNDRPKCKCCDNKVNYIDFTHGYRTYCSVKCQTNDPEIIKKGLKKKEEKYGADNLTNHKKTKQTKLERYGDPYYTNIDKIKQTMISRYNVDNPMKNSEISKKSLENKIKKYGEDNISNQKKIRQTCIERYGVKNIFILSDIIKKSKQTKLERYGDENYSNREKFKQTCLKRYGCEYPAQNISIKEKQKQTCLKKYKVDNIAKSTYSQNKSKQTSIDKYGVEYYTQSQEYKKHIKEITPQIQEKIYKTKKENGTFNSSSIEELFEKWLIDNKINYISQYQSDEYPFNCDFYFPDKKLYLEIQGFWGHGGHPYDPENIDDIKKANIWKEKGTKFYLNNYDVWTRRDPLKRQWAKDHNLNWKEIFTYKLDELLGEIKDLIS